MKTRQIRIRERGNPRSRVALRSLSVALLQCFLVGAVFSAGASAEVGVSPANNAGDNLVVWADRGIKGAFVDMDARVGSTLEISWRSLSGSTPSTATDGRDHLVVWGQSRSVENCFMNGWEIHGAIVRADATVSEQFPIATADGPCDVQGAYPSLDRLFAPRVGFDGTNYFVVWNSFRDLNPAMIEGARVTPAGVVLDPGGKPLILAPENAYFARPHLVFDGTNFLVTYYRAMGDLCFCTRGLFATRVNTDATPVALDPAGIPLSAGSQFPGVGPDMEYGGVAHDGLNWIVVWNQRPYGSANPYPSGLIAARVTSAGVVLDPLGVKVAGYSYDRDGPSVVFDGSNLLVVWGGRFGPPAQAMILRTDLATGFEVLRPQFPIPLEEPEAALSVDRFLVVSELERWPSPDVRGLRIDLSGNVLDAEPFRISTPDTTPPETTISASPPALSNATTATFEFEASESSWFECKLDSQPFSDCSSPMTYAGLAEDAHRFEVLARDLANNVDATPATWSWTIDTVAPETSIKSGPASLTNQATASFSFASSDRDAGFECSLDGGTVAACTSPATYAGLGDGSHTFDVRAVDGAGNVDATPATWAWKVDATAPGTPSLIAPANGSSTSNAKPTFDWSEAVDHSVVTYAIEIDNSGSTFPSPEVIQSGLTTSAFTPAGSLAAGTYSWRVRATDAAGNVGAWSEVFTVTITVPPGTIAGTVTSQTTKKGIGGAAVDCGSAGSATTAADGTFTIANVIPGSYPCTASASGHKSLTKSVTVKSNATVTANFALRKA